MNSNMMINPANYYNPFAKYNYVSKTRGVYIPRDTEPLLRVSKGNVDKSTSIYSENYDAEADLLQSMNNMPEDLKTSHGFWGMITKFFNNTSSDSTN
ncbi:MAG: hypothetical protein KHX03_09900 [Clostridium sp.]|nr:hypothetical protein [Clostridium sp.]